MYTGQGLYESGQRFSLAGMYGGQTARGLGCGDGSCVDRTATRLGILPAVAALVVQQAPAILQDIANLFGGTGSYTQTQQTVMQWVQLILSNPAQAVSGQYTPGNNPTASPANAYLWLNCAAGNETILSTYRQISGDPSPNGCGFETQYGGRQGALAALQRVNTALNQPMPATSTAPIPTNPTSGLPSSTIATGLPGGVTVGIPVPTSSIMNATVFGIPVVLVAGAVAAIAFAGGRRGRA